MSPKEQCEQLLGATIPFVEKTLEEYGEFHPLGCYMNHDGSISLASVYDGDEVPASQELIDMLNDRVSSMAGNGEIVASAVVYDVRITLPSTGAPSDAIVAALDHRDGYSVEVIFPYTLDGGTLTFGETLAQHGAGRIFGG